jgi:hypothetical protein
MRLAPVPALAAALLLAACGTTIDPGATAPTTVPPVVSVPAADGPVTGVGTVIETADGEPELCLGPVAESWPPQCEGVPLSGWSWAEHEPEQVADTGPTSTSWGSFAVTGTFDGQVLTVTDAVPLALYDTVAEPSPSPAPTPELTEQQWAAVTEEVQAAPGLLTVDRPDGTGPVQVAVVHDDGSVQAWADASFGIGAVVVTSALR